MTTIAARAAEKLKENGPFFFALKAARYPFRPLLVPIASRVLRRRAERCAGLPEAIALAKSFAWGGVTATAWQLDPEILALLETLERRRPRTVVEIGTANGGALFLFTRVAADDALVVSIDLPRARFGGGYPAWKAPLYRSFARARQRVELIRADSHAASTFEQLQRVLAGRPIDFLFVDGDHSYDGVKADFELYAPLVAEDGVVAFHDIVPGEEEFVGGVPRFWNEVKGGYDSSEHVHDWDFGSCGIGVLDLAGSPEREAAPASAAPAPLGDACGAAQGNRG